MKRLSKWARDFLGNNPGEVSEANLSSWYKVEKKILAAIAGKLREAKKAGATSVMVYALITSEDFVDGRIERRASFDVGKKLDRSFVGGTVQRVIKLCEAKGLDCFPKRFRIGNNSYYALEARQSRKKGKPSKNAR
ncbi:MAG: hypothetical protein AAB467_01885 [Patescibacteria group bacterium]